MDGAILAGLAGLLGLAWGYVSDRIAARWPAHEDGSVRARDWRTILVVLLGGASFAATVARFGARPEELLVIGLYVIALVLLFATDLDQKLLPDVITLPLVLYALLAFVTGWGPYVNTTEDLAWAGAAAIVEARPLLERELAQVAPRVVVCLGQIAAAGVLGRIVKLAEARGKFFPSAYAEETLVTASPKTIAGT